MTKRLLHIFLRRLCVSTASTELLLQPAAEALSSGMAASGPSCIETGFDTVTVVDARGLARDSQKLLFVT